MRKRIFGKVLIERAAAELYESLNKDDYGGVPWSQVPDDEKLIWIQNATKWISNFAAASLDLVTIELTDSVADTVTKLEFPIDSVTKLMVVRSEAILEALEKLRTR